MEGLIAQCETPFIGAFLGSESWEGESTKMQIEFTPQRSLHGTQECSSKMGNFLGFFISFIFPVNNVILHVTLCLVTKEPDAMNTLCFNHNVRDLSIKWITFTLFNTM